MRIFLFSKSYKVEIKPPLFLNWNTPWLPQLAERLLTSWAEEIKKPPGNLSESVLILPGRRAGRRLLQLLAIQAAERQITLLPPKIVTLREAIPLLLPLGKKVESEAGALARHMAWSEAVKELTPEEWATLNAETFFSKRETHFIHFIEQLGDHLGMQGVSFSSVLEKIGTLYPESVDREEARWKTLTALQKKYQTLLHHWGFLDPYELLTSHLKEGKPTTSYQALVAGVIDAPLWFAPFFEKVNPSLFIIAPAEHAGGFDTQGRVIPSYWLAHPPSIKESQIFPCYHQEDQAEELLQLLRSYQGIPEEAVTIATSADSLPLLRDYLARIFHTSQSAAWPKPMNTVSGSHSLSHQLFPSPRFERYETSGLEEKSFKLHWAGGLPFFQGRLYQLLEATAHFLQRKNGSSPSCQAIGALLRHPDVGCHLPHLEDLLRELDDYERNHPSACLERKTFPPFLELEKVISLPFSGTLESCVKELRNFLFRLLGSEIVSSRTSEGHYLLESFKKLYEQLEELEEISGLASEQKTSLWKMEEVILLLLKVLSSATVPEKEEPQAIECVGWLELMADDAPCAVVTSCYEGFLPRSPTPHLLFPERLYEAFGLDESSTFLARDFYLLQLINHSRELKIIAPCYNARREFVRPSRLLTLGCSQKELPTRILTLLQPLQKKEKNLTTVSSSLKARPIGKESIEKVTVTALRTYLASPRLFYLQHVLKLKEVSSAPLEMDSSHFGMLLHAVLGAFGKEAALAESTEEKLLADWLQKKLFTLAASRYGLPLSPLIKLQLEEASKTLAGFAKIQAAHRRDGWKIITVENEVEEKIMLADGRSLLLQGRIDRLDWHPLKKRWLLIDYKTSNQQQWERATPNAQHYHQKGETIEWKDLQLPLYLKLISCSESLLARIFHTSHSEATEKADETRKAMNSDQGCMNTYRSDQNSSLTQYPSALAKLQTERYEISGLAFGLPLPTLENTDLCYCQLPLEYERACFSPYFNPNMILPAWEEAQRVLTCILDHQFEEIGTIDTARTPTFAALCGVVG